MNITNRFNALLCNFDPLLTIKSEFQHESDKYTIYITRLEYNIYSAYESYERIVIRNKLTEHCDAYYLDARTDINIYFMIMGKINEMEQNNNRKRKADTNIDLEHAFKKMKLDETKNNDQIIEDIQQSLKRKRDNDDNYEQINKKQKTNL